MIGSLLLSQIATAAPAAGGEALLPMLVIVPLLVALAVAFVKDASLARAAAVGGSLATLLLGVLLLWKVGLTPATSGVLVWEAPSILRLGEGGFSFSFAADAISVWLVLLAGVLVPCALLATAREIERPNAYYAWMLVLLATLIGAFLASDVILFYVFFELTLVPSFFLVAQWGGAERRYAAVKFFVYTFAGSLFMLASILYLVSHAGSANIARCVHYAQASLTHGEQFWVLIGFLAGLGVKVPLIPFHTWLPTAYTTAPAPVSALLTGALAKLGTYGLLRIAVPAGLIDAHGNGGQHAIAMWLVGLSLVGIIYAALVAWTQKDAKTLVAYSSISHLGFCVLAIVGVTTLGGQAALLYMVNHGISAAGLFLLLGFVETRFATRSLDQLSGLGRERPWLAGLFILFVMSSIGLPATNGFVSEFLAILSTRASGMSMWVTVLAASGIVLGAIYMLSLAGRLIFGPPKQPAEVNSTPPDLNGRELLAVLPLAALVIVLGVMPNLVLRSTESAVARLNASAGAAILVEAPAVDVVAVNLK